MKLEFLMLLLPIGMECALGSGCSSNQRLMTPPRITATGPVYRTTAVSPEIGDVVAFYFTLADAEDVPVDVAVEVKRLGGEFIAVGIAGGGTIANGGDGVNGLTAPPLGRQHRLLWKPPAELRATDEVRFRLTPTEPPIQAPPMALAEVIGASVTAAPFTLETLQPEPR